MRGRRSAKFAEYISTYAILQGIGVHPTTLIEKRDGVVGVGVYVRDACDAGTTLLVVPSSRVCASSSLSNLGAAVALDTTPWTSRDASCSISSASHATATRTLGANARSGESQHTVRGSQDSHCASVHALAGSVDIRSSDTVAYPSDSVDSAHDSHASDLMGCLTQSASTLHWAVWCWRTALERHRTHSWLWGWLQSVPSPEEFAEVHARAAQLCRVHHVQLYPSYAHARARLAREVRSVYDHLSQVNLAPSYANFSWAADVLLSRSVLLPRCFGDALHSDRWRSPSQPDYANHSHPVLSSAPSRASAELSTEETPSEPHIELAVAPLIDLVNGPDNMDQSQRNIDACFCAHVHQHEQPRRRANTTLEVAFDASELPSWYVDWVRDEAAGYSSSCMNRGEGNSARKRYGSTTLESDCDAIVSDTYPTLLSDAATQRQQLWQQNSPFFLCLTLTCDVPASTELILPYTLPSLTTGALSAHDDMLLTRLLKYSF